MSDDNENQPRRNDGTFTKASEEVEEVEEELDEEQQRRAAARAQHYPDRE